MSLSDILQKKNDYEKMLKIAEIKALKAELSSSDWKVIKCSEYQLANKELPYDVEELYAERQAIRDQINELEA